MILSPTPSNTPSNTPSYSPTSTDCPTPTPTKTSTQTQTNTQTGTAVATQTPTNTQTQTSTPTNTPTITPSPTSCYQPKAYILFDSQTGSTALNTWMASQGSTFRGMFINGPSVVPATFEAQMNAYISYSGFGPSQYYSLLPQNITPNQDPILWPVGAGPTWEATSVWVNMFVPTCPICDGGEYGLMGANGVAIHTTNSIRRSIPFYYSGTAMPTGYYRLYTTYAATDMRLSSNGVEYILGTLQCPATPTPSPTTTQTQTPSVTQTQTSTPTVTPTSFAVCPTEMYIDGISGIWTLPDQSYYRLNYYDNVVSAGTFTGGYLYFNGSTTTFIPGASPSGITYSVFGTFSGTDYYNIVAYTTNLSTYSWRGFKALGDYYINTGTLISSSILNSTAVGTTIDGVVFPNPGKNNLNSANVIYPSICPTATATPTTTSTPTETPSVSPTQTTTSTPTETPSVTSTQTQTPSSTPPCTNTIYTHGAIRATCSDFCTTNYLIQTIDCASEVYASLSIGDFIYGYSGQAGYLAYSNVSTDTNTGPFRIADIDGTGEILGIYVCSGGSCIPL